MNATISKLLVVTAGLVLAVAAASAQTGASAPIPDFEATSLTGKTVHSAQLRGRPTILLVMPGRDAEAQTRQWADTLRGRLDPQAYRVRAVLAVDLPFFLSEADAVGRARDEIPKRYWDETWLATKSEVETALDIPGSSRKAFVFVLDGDGSVVAQASGAPTGRRVRAIVAAAGSLR